MALFKIFKGLKDNLTFENRPWNEGYCYYTTDDSKFYIDAYKQESSTTRVADRTYFKFASGTYTEFTPTTAVGASWNEGETELFFQSRTPLNANITDYAVRAYKDQYGNNLNSIIYSICDSNTNITNKEAAMDIAEVDGDNFSFIDGQLMIVNFIYGTDEIDDATIDFDGIGNQNIIVNNENKIVEMPAQTLALFRYDTGSWTLISGGTTAGGGASGTSSVQLVRWGEEEDE